MLVSPWLLAVALGLATVGGLLVAGPFGLVVPGAVTLMTVLGSRDFLGPMQPGYAMFDTQVSLFVASMKLLRGEGSAVWEVDEELRDVYK
jgi:hypothetical protein